MCISRLVARRTGGRIPVVRFVILVLAPPKMVRRVSGGSVSWERGYQVTLHLLEGISSSAGGPQNWPPKAVHPICSSLGLSEEYLLGLFKP